jgi:phage-related protein
MAGKLIFWLHGKIKTPPFSTKARRQTGYWLRKLQRGEMLQMPISRPMPSIGSRCHELRINDINVTWRIIYRIDDDAIIIVEVFKKKTNKTPKKVIDICQERLNHYNKYS